MRKFYIILPFLLQIIGILGLFWTLGVSKKEDSLLFSDISGFVVDSNKNIYIGLGLHGKIQIYNNEGKFLRAWSTECDQSYVELTKEENLLITSIKCKEQYTYNSFGKLLSTVIKNDSFNDSIQNNWNTFRNKQGEIYKITSTYNIIKLQPDNKIIISQNILLKTLKCPLLYFLIIWIGILYGLNYASKNGLLGKSNISLFQFIIKDLRN